MSFIVSVHTKQNLELPWAVVNANSTQPLWELIQVEQGYSRIVYKASGQDLAVAEGGVVTLETPSDDRSHQWKIGQTGGISVVLESRSANQLLQVDDAGVLSLGQPRYSSTQYWTVEPVEGDAPLPEQQPMQAVVEMPIQMEPIHRPYNVEIAIKRANNLKIVILVVSILILIGGLIGTAASAYGMIIPGTIQTSAGTEEQLAPVDYLIDLLSGLFSILGAIVGIASTMDSIKRRAQYILTYVFIAFLTVRMIIAAVVEGVAPIDPQAVNLVGSVEMMMLLQWLIFGLCALLPAALCCACAGMRVRYMKVQDKSVTQQVDDSREIEMQNLNDM